MRGWALRATAVTAALLAFGASPGHAAPPACTVTWDGGAGTNSWHAAANWSGNALPGPGAHVCIPAGSRAEHTTFGTTTEIASLQGAGTVRLQAGEIRITADTEAVLAALELAGGTVSGAGRLTLSGRLDWTGGEMSGAGLTETQPSAPVSIVPTNFSTVFLRDTRTLRVAGTATWPSGNISLSDFSLLEILGTLDANSETGNVAQSGGGGPRVRIAGLLRKSAGTGLTQITAPLENDGSADAQTGTLRLSSGAAGVTSTGTFGASGGLAELQLGRLFGGEFFLGAGAAITNRVELNGRVSVDGPVTMSGLGNELVFGAELRGFGTLSVTGSLLASGGDMTGSGITAIRPAGTLAIDGGLDLAGSRLLRVQGTATWTSGAMSLGNASRIENLGVFDVRTDTGQMSSSFTRENEFYNRGTLTKTAGTGTTTINVVVVNDGVVDPRSGTLRFSEISGNGYSQTVDGRQRVELRGPVAGTGFGVVSHSGTARLNGTLEIVTAPGFSPAIGSSFTIVTYGTRNGDFATVLGTQIDAGKRYQVQYGPTAVTLSVVASPRAESDAEAAPPAAEPPAPAVTGLRVLTAGGDRFLAMRVSRRVSFTARLERAGQLVRRLRPRALTAGRHRIALGGLRPGRYRLRIVVRDKAGARVTKTVSFRSR